VDGKGAYAIPGLVDIHFHGCVGEDVCDASPEGLQKMADYEASVGVTSICPATMTVSKEELHVIMSNAGNYKGKSGAKLVGINMEGPFINPAKKGAQAEVNIIPCDVELFRKLQVEAKGLIKLVDIAPEEPGAMEFIQKVKDEVVVSIAHTMSDYDTAKQAFELGASHVTHLYNAMPPLNHRNPGVIGAAAEQEKCHVELICDGVHIHPAVVRATFAMFGGERIILISDSMRGTGLEDGTYTLGGQEVHKKCSWATLSDGTIAGSVTNLMSCMVTAVKKMQIPLETAVACASENPAREIGIFEHCGSITYGKDADLVLLDSDLNIQAVYLKGIHY
jgi:N-acetylglucosamine-6-phosphate deacetylase